MNNYCVYKHESPSGKVYIGMTKMIPEARWKGGWGYCSQAFYRAIQKYGWNNFKHEIIAEGLSQEDACNKEQEMIAFYDSTNPSHGYNMTSGGEHYEPSAETREKERKAQIRYYKEHPEARERISQRQKGRKQNPQSNAKRSATMKAYYTEHPERTKLCGNSFRGKKRSESTRLLMSQNSARAKAILCIETAKIFRSTAEAAKEMSIVSSAITNALCGRAKSAAGYHWQYVAAEK